MIVSRFGPTWATAHPFRNVKMEHDIAPMRPPVVTQVGGAGGVFDYYGARNFPIAALPLQVAFRLRGSTYTEVGFLLDALKAATVDRGEDRLWAVHRDGLLKRWAWAKCTKLSAAESPGKNFTTLDVVLDFHLREGLWYGENAYSIARDQDGPADFNITYFGRQPGLLTATIAPTTNSDTIAHEATQTETSENTYNFTITSPSTTAEDVLMAIVAIGDADQGIRTPDGWTRRAALGSGNVFAAVFTRVVKAGDPAEYTFVTETGQPVYWCGVCSAFSGANAASVINALTGTSTAHGSDDEYTATGLATARANSWLIVLAAHDDEVTATAPSGMTERGDVTSGGINLAATLCTELRAAAGATGDRVGALSGNASGVAFAFELYAAGDALTDITIANTTIGRSLTWSGTVGAGDSLVIDTAAASVLNGGVDAYGGLSQILLPANASDSLAFMWLAPGRNDMSLVASPLNDFAAVFSWYDTFT